MASSISVPISRLAITLAMLAGIAASSAAFADRALAQQTSSDALLWQTNRDRLDTKNEKKKPDFLPQPKFQNFSLGLETDTKTKSIETARVPALDSNRRESNVPFVGLSLTAPLQ